MSKPEVDRKKCVHCGACTAACSNGALYMKTTDWTLAFNSNCCTSCNACVKACPLRAIRIKV